MKYKIDAVNTGRCVSARPAFFRCEPNAPLSGWVGTLGNAGLAPLAKRWKPPSPWPLRGNFWIVGKPAV